MLYITYTKHDGTLEYDLSHDASADELQKHLQSCIDQANRGVAIVQSMDKYKSVIVEDEK